VSATAGKVSVPLTTVTVMLACALAVPSVTAAVIVWVPRARLARSSGDPVPRLPLRLDVQRTAAARLPPCASVAVARSCTGVAVNSVAPFAGLSMVMVGTPLPVFTTNVRVA